MAVNRTVYQARSLETYPITLYCGFQGAGAAQPTDVRGRGVSVEWLASTGLYRLTWTNCPNIHEKIIGGHVTLLIEGTASATAGDVIGSFLIQSGTPDNGVDLQFVGTDGGSVLEDLPAGTWAMVSLVISNSSGR